MPPYYSITERHYNIQITTGLEIETPALKELILFNIGCESMNSLTIQPGEIMHYKSIFFLYNFQNLAMQCVDQKT